MNQRTISLTPSDDGADFARLRHLFIEREPSELRGYLAVPIDGVPAAAGSGVPLITGPTFGLVERGGLLLPHGAFLAGPSDHTGVFLTLDDYVDARSEGGERIPSWLIADYLAGRYERDVLIADLAILNWVIQREGKQGQLAEEFATFLLPDPRHQLQGALKNPAGAGGRVFLARHPLLASMRHLLLSEPREPAGAKASSRAVAAMLSHAVASDLDGASEDTEEMILGRPAHLVLEVTRSGLLSNSEDIYATIDRTVRLWRDFGARITRYPTRVSPAELLHEATRIELEDLLALGFLLIAYTTNWEPERSPFMRADLGTGVEAEKVEAFIKIVAATVEEFQAAYEGRGSRFDFLPFQERPVLRTDQGLLVLDQGYVWDRVTSGLYWLVHDHERARGNRDRVRWTQAYAEMVELMCEDQLRGMAPPILGEGRTFFTEEDFGEAYPGKRCDAAIDFGGVMAMFEIVSGQVSVPTRIEGRPGALVADTERLVVKKCRQLDEAASAFLADETKLTGYPAVPGRRVLPVVVVGGGYPVNVLTLEMIETMRRTRGLLEDARVNSLAIIDLGELELLEGLSENGPGPHEVLRDWTASTLRGVPLGTFLHRRFGSSPKLRHSRMQSAVDAIFARRGGEAQVAPRVTCGERALPHPDADCLPAPQPTRAGRRPIPGSRASCPSRGRGPWPPRQPPSPWRLRPPRRLQRFRVFRLGLVTLR